MTTTTVATIEIDYSRYGHARQMTVPLFKRERTLRVGDRVQIVGDDVPTRTAVVTSLTEDGRHAVLDLVDAA